MKNNIKISFNNFKPFGEKLQTFSKKPITLVYGSNSIGKTSLLELMAYRYKVRESLKLDISEIKMGDTISLGSFKNFIYKKDKYRKLRLDYDLTSTATLSLIIGISDNDQKASIVKITYYVNAKMIIEIDNNLLRINMQNKLTQKILAIIKENGNWTNTDINNVLGDMGIIEYQLKDKTLLGLFTDAFHKHELDDDFFMPNMGRLPTDELNDKLMNWNKFQEDKKVSVKALSESSNLLEDIFPENNNIEDDKYNTGSMTNGMYIQSYLLNNEDTLSLKNILMHLTIDANLILNSEFHKKQKEFIHIGPLRFYPERYSAYKEQKELRSNRSEDFWMELKDKPNLMEKLNIWLEKLNTPYSIGFKRLYNFDNLYSDTNKKLTRSEIKDKSSYIEELIFTDKFTNTPVHNTEIGLGIVQILPVVGNSIELEKHIISIEQPELNLHPELHGVIADEFIRSYNENENEFFIETHSRDMLKQLIKRMKESKDNTLKNKNLALLPEDICVLYLQRNENNDVQISELDLMQIDVLKFFDSI